MDRTATDASSWMSAGENATARAVFALFFVSGFAALLYQVIWQRVLAIFSGADVFSVTIVVAAFMAGLGCGSLVGGYVADRVSAGTGIVLFALAELAVAAFAFVSLWLYHDVLYLRLSHLARTPLLLALVLFASLLWPTFFMGMSLPLLGKALTRRIERAASLVGSLYAFNTLGAAAGAFLTTWWFMGALGFERTVYLGGVLNTCAAVGALMVLPHVLARRAAHVQPARAQPAGPQGAAAATQAGHAAPATTGLPVPVWMAVYGVSGFVALSLEIVWFRMLGVMLKSTSLTFGHLLSIFLAGLTIGTFAGLRWTQRSTQPALVFLALQAAISVYAGVSLLLLTMSLEHIPPVWAYLGRYEPLNVLAALRDQRREFVLMYLVLPLAITGPPTVLMGVSFPFLQRVVQRDLAVLGRRLGWLQAANIFGSMLGAGLTGWGLLRLLGTAGTLKALVLCGAFFLVLIVIGARGGRRVARWASGAAVAGCALCLLVWFMPGPAPLWGTLHGTTPDRMISAEDESGLSVLKNLSVGFRGETVVYANGLGQSAVPFPGHHIALGLVPVMLHPDPKQIAIVGLGSGATLYAAGGRQETEQITLIEIVAPQLETLRRLEARNGYGGLVALLADRRITYTFADARAVVRFGGKTYDIIESDALRPTSAYAGNLYSVEYFTLLRNHLAPGGLAVSWAPTRRVVDTFVKVFPHAMLYQQPDITMLIGSNQALAWNPAVVSERLGRQFSRSYVLRARGGRHRAVFRDLRKSAARDVRRGVRPLDDRGREHGPVPERRVPRAALPVVKRRRPRGRPAPASLLLALSVTRRRVATYTDGMCRTDLATRGDLFEGPIAP